MKLSKMIAAPLAAAALLAAPSAYADESTAPTKGEIKLAKMLEGRVAGEPQNCIRTLPNLKLTMIDETALVYKSGRTLYVNIPSDPGAIDNDDTLVTRRFGSRLCNTTIVTTIDRFHGGYTGNIFLGQFVPYRKES